MDTINVNELYVSIRKGLQVFKRLSLTVMDTTQRKGEEILLMASSRKKRVFYYNTSLLPTVLDAHASDLVWQFSGSQHWVLCLQETEG